MFTFQESKFVNIFSKFVTRGLTSFQRYWLQSLRHCLLLQIFDYLVIEYPLTCFKTNIFYYPSVLQFAGVVKEKYDIFCFFLNARYCDKWSLTLWHRLIFAPPAVVHIKRYRLIYLLLAINMN